MEQEPVDKDMLYIIVQDFTKEGNAHWKKTTSSEKDTIAFLYSLFGQDESC